MEMVTNLQLKKMSKIFKRSGKTFQNLATEAGFVLLPDHASELTKEDARLFLKYFGGYLVEPKEKQ
jgi:hypothetical protein